MCQCNLSNSNIPITNECGCNNTNIINPLIILPITSTEEASNNYSVDVKIKSRNSNVSQNDRYTGQAVGDNNEELIEYIHNHLVEIVTDIVRSIIGEDYTGPAPFNESVHLNSLQIFQNYFSNTGSVDPEFVPVTNVSKKAYLDYISFAMYSLFLSIRSYIEDTQNSIIICSSNGSQVIKIVINNCLFCLTFIYN